MTTPTTPTNTPAICQQCDFIKVAHVRQDPHYITYRCDNEDSPKWEQRVFCQTRACEYFTPKKHRDNETGNQD